MLKIKDWNFFKDINIFVNYQDNGYSEIFIFIYTVYFKYKYKFGFTIKDFLKKLKNCRLLSRFQKIKLNYIKTKLS